MEMSARSRSYFGGSASFIWVGERCAIAATTFVHLGRRWKPSLGSCDHPTYPDHALQVDFGGLEKANALKLAQGAAQELPELAAVFGGRSAQGVDGGVFHWKGIAMGVIEAVQPLGQGRQLEALFPIDLAVGDVAEQREDGWFEGDSPTLVRHAE